MASAEMQHASDSKHCRRCGAAYVYDAIYLGHLGLYRCPDCGQQRPDPTVAAEQRRPCTAPAPPASRCAPRPGRADVDAAAAGPLQRLQRARRRGAVPGAGRDRWTRSPTGWSTSAPPSDGPSGSRVGEHELSVLLIKNPAGANEILRTLALEPGELDVLGVLNDRTADGRDVSWIWDADFELLAGQVRQRHLRGDAGGRAGAAAEVRRGSRRPPGRRPRAARRAGPDRAGGSRGRRRCTRCRPTPRCSSCATSSRAAATSAASVRPRRRWPGERGDLA